MNLVLGFGVTGLSVMLAAIVSGLRLKPYLDAGETHTPLTFAFYPALIAAAITVPVVLILRKWQGKTAVDIGPVTFPGNMPFIALGCLLYIIVAVTFFPYRKPPAPSFPPKRPSPQKSVTPNRPGDGPALVQAKLSQVS